MDNGTSSGFARTASARKGIFLVLAGFVLLMLAGGFYLASSKGGTGLTALLPGEGGSGMPSIMFAGTQYARIHTFPPSEDPTLVSESYEWAPQGSSADALTSLVTTHKMSSKDASKPISAKVYAENVAAMNEKQGATIIETSVINTPEAVKEAGIDANNPPYLIVYAYPSSTSTPIEVDMQKVINGTDGTVEAFVYSFPLNAKTEQDVIDFFKSDEFVSKRAEVIKAAFPY